MIVGEKFKTICDGKYRFDTKKRIVGEYNFWIRYSCELVGKSWLML